MNFEHQIKDAMNNSVLIQNVTAEELYERLRSAIREEILSQQANQPISGSEKHLTRKETAEMLRISLPTLNSYTKNGLLKAHSIGNRVLYSESDIKTAILELPSRRLRNFNKM